jgi:hypothetical protein
MSSPPTIRHTTGGQSNNDSLSIIRVARCVAAGSH